MHDEGLTKSLAEFCANLRYEDLPDQVVIEAKRILLDTIGVGLGGHVLDKGKMGVKLAQMSGGVAEASIIGTNAKVPAGQAAFANGELMNALDWCPVLPPAHVSAYVMPPALAVAQARGKSGKDLLTALVVAMAVTGRSSDAPGGLRSKPGGLPRRVWGLSSNQVGGAAGVGNLMGLETARMQHALGIAGYFAPVASHVKFNYTVEQGYSKYGPSGWMAQGCVTTGLLAEMGYHGDTTFLEGDYGFHAQIGTELWRPEKIRNGLGETWMFTNVGFKPWPTCGVFQSSCNILHDMITEYDLKPDEIDALHMNCDEIGSLPAYVSATPKDHVEAASSGPYIAAVIAHGIKRGPRMQDQSVIDDPSIRAFMQKVVMGVNPRCEEMRHQDINVEGRAYARHRLGHVIIKARGQVFERSTDFCDWLSMDPDYRATDAGLAVKFRENAEVVLNAGKTEQAIEAIFNLENLDTLDALFDPLTP